MGCCRSPNVGSFIASSVHSKKSGITKGVEQGNIKPQYQVYINPFHFPVTFVSPESHTHHSVSLLSLFIHFPTENAASTTSGPIWSCILLLELCHFSWSARCMYQGMFCAWKLHVYQGNVLWLKTASTFWSVISLSARLLLFPSCECRTLLKLDRQQKEIVSSYPFKPVTVFDFPCSSSIVWCVFLWIFQDYRVVQQMWSCIMIQTVLMVSILAWTSLQALAVLAELCVITFTAFYPLPAHAWACKFEGIFQWKLGYECMQAIAVWHNCDTQNGSALCTCILFTSFCSLWQATNGGL